MKSWTEEFLKRFEAWALMRPDIRAAVLVGSHARTDRPADQWSDVDLVVVTTEARRLLEETGWIAELGTPLITITEPTATGKRHEVRALFEGGEDVDFIPLSVEELSAWTQEGPQAELADVLRRGFRWLVDKDGLAPSLDWLRSVGPDPFDPRELDATIRDFWYHAVWTAKKLARGELWMAKACCDVHMKQLLLRMIQWHARATQGPSHDTWFRGRFLEEWADEGVREKLRHVFAVYDRESVRAALVETMDLFSSLTAVVTARHGVPRTDVGERRARQIAERLLAG